MKGDRGQESGCSERAFHVVFISTLPTSPLAHNVPHVVGAMLHAPALTTSVGADPTCLSLPKCFLGLSEPRLAVLLLVPRRRWTRGAAFEQDLIGVVYSKQRVARALACPLGGICFWESNLATLLSTISILLKVWRFLYCPCTRSVFVNYPWVLKKNCVKGVRYCAIRCYEAKFVS